MPRGETSNVADGLEHVVAAETVLSKVDGEAGVLILRGHYLQDIAGRRSFEWLTGVLWQDFVNRRLDEDALRRDLGLARERAFSRLHDLLPIAGRLPPLAAVRVLLASVPDDPAARRQAACRTRSACRSRRGFPAHAEGGDSHAG
jgi:citrate synthase